MAKKSFPTLGVVGAWSGILLKERGFDEIREVFDHLYPGIMTMGIAAMAEHASKYLGATVPALRGYTLPTVNLENFAAVAAGVLEHFGPTLEVNGPASVSNAEIEKAFDEMSERIEARP